MPQTITTKADAMAAQLSNIQPLTHKQMAAHLRKRFKHEGIKARVQMKEYSRLLWIDVIGVTYEQEFTEDEQRIVRRIGKRNGLTWSMGMEIDIEQMTNLKRFGFLFHGPKYDWQGNR